MNTVTKKLLAFSNTLTRSLRLLMRNDPLRMAGATAFFTLFSLPPILLMLLQLLGTFIPPQKLQHEMFSSLSDVVGRESVQQIVSVIRGVREMAFGGWTTIAGILFLVFVATTVFRIIKSSINQLWRVKLPAKKLARGILERLQSLLIIMVTGILFSLGILLETIQLIIGNYLIRLLPEWSGMLSEAFAILVSLVIISGWFTIILRYLNDARPGWRIAWTGGVFTGVMFYIGKSLLHVLLRYGQLNNLYGASAALVLLLLFVFYSSLILYFGAAFTKTYQQHYSSKER